MEWSRSIPGFVLGLREGLEAFLVISVMAKFLERAGRPDLKVSVRNGLIIGVVGSIALGLALWFVAAILDNSSSAVAKVWESVASLAAMVLLTTFILWMMRHGKTIVSDVQRQVGAALSRAGVLGLAVVVVLREGAEIVLFAFASVHTEHFLVGIVVGVVASALLAYLFFLSLIRVNLGILFRVTLVYLVLQAGYLLGYAIHELLSTMKTLGLLATDSALQVKAFDLQGGLLDHKEGAVGIALNVLVGWYASPEWIQFALHYAYVLGMFLLWASYYGRLRTRH
jgi:high-affinity iron transporter